MLPVFVEHYFHGRGKFHKRDVDRTSQARYWQNFTSEMLTTSQARCWQNFTSEMLTTSQARCWQNFTSEMLTELHKRDVDRTSQARCWQNFTCCHKQTAKLLSRATRSHGDYHSRS